MSRKTLIFVALFVGLLISACCLSASSQTVAVEKADRDRCAIGAEEFNAVRRLRAASVRVKTSTGIGSGFVVGITGDVATIWSNNHVAGGVGSTVTIEFEGGAGASQIGKVVSSKRTQIVDASIIECRIPEGQKVCYLTPSEDIQEGAFLVGSNPRGGDFRLGFWQSSDKDSRRGEFVDPIFEPGQSGGFVIGRDGQVCGVATNKVCDTERHGFYLRETECYGEFFSVKGWLDAVRK